MISQINLNGFGNLPDIVQPLERLNLFTGANGVGKSARSIGIFLTVFGYVPGGPKKNADILSAYGGGEKFFVGITADKSRFMRRFCRKEDGTVSQDYLLNGRAAKARDYLQAIAGVRVLDLRAFMELSDQKKIDHIFSLYPPAGDLATIEDQIEALKTKQNSLAEKIRGLEQTTKRLATARAEMQLPAGTLSEVAQEILEIETQLKSAREEYLQLQVKEAQDKAAEQARKDAEAKAAAELPKIEAEAMAKAESAVYVKQQEAQQANDERVVVGVATLFAGNAPAADSIRAILDTMQRAGCTSCAAGLVAKRELRKLQPERKVA